MSKDFVYEGFSEPNYTPVPDDLFDLIAPNLTEAELRVLLYIIRRTFGFKRQSDAISLSQMVDGITTRDGKVLDRGTGLSRRGVMNGCSGLVDKHIITVTKRLSAAGDNEINHALRFREVGQQMPYPRELRAPPVGQQMPPQETVIQETDGQDFESSKEPIKYDEDRGSCSTTSRTLPGSLPTRRRWPARSHGLRTSTGSQGCPWRPSSSGSMPPAPLPRSGRPASAARPMRMARSSGCHTSFPSLKIN